MSYPYRRESHGLRTIFDTPAATRWNSQQRTSRNGYRGHTRNHTRTPSAVMGTSRPSSDDAADAWSVLARHGMQPPDNIMKPPSTNKMVREMFEILFTVIIGPRDFETPTPDSRGRDIMQTLTILGYRANDKLERILRQQFLVANTETSWPTVLPAVAFLARVVLRLEEPALAPIDINDASINLTTKIEHLCLERMGKMGDPNFSELDGYLERLREKKTANLSDERDLAVRKLELMDENDKIGILEIDCKDAEADEARLDSFWSQIQPHVAKLQAIVEDQSIEVKKVQKRELELNKTQSELELDLKNNGVSVSEAQRLEAESRELEQKIERAASSVSELNKRRQNLLDASFDQRNEIWAVLEESYQRLNKEIGDGSLLDLARDIIDTFDQELESNEPQNLELYRKVETDRALCETAFFQRCAIKESNRELQTNVTVLTSDCEALESVYDQRCQRASAKRDEDIKHLESMRVEAARQRDLSKQRLAAENTKSSQLEKQLHDKVMPLLGEMRRKRLLVDRITTELGPSILELQSVAKSCVQLVEQGAEKISRLPPIQTVILPNIDSILAKMKANLQAQIDAL